MNECNEIILEYLKKSQTDYALMVTGPWGSGKTFYVKNTLKKFIEKHDYRMIYVSLNGVSDPQKIIDTVLVEILAEKAGSTVKNLLPIGGQVLLNGINLSAGFFSFAANQNQDLFKSLKESITKKILPRFGNTLFVFDDLERTTDLEKIPEMLGTIHRNFIEHNYAKVLFIANEEELAANHYPRIREKVIGRVIKYSVDANHFVPEFIAGVEASKDVKEFLKKEESLVTQTFKQHGDENIRTLRFIVESFIRIFNEIKDVKNVKQLLPQILYFTSIISFEFKAGKLNSSDVETGPKLDHVSVATLWLGNKEKKLTDEEQYLVDFYKKYLRMSTVDYIYLAPIFNYILTGYLDVAALRKELEKMLESSSEKVQAYWKLERFEELNFSELQGAYNDVLSFASEGEYLPLDYLAIWNRAEILKKNNILSIKLNDDFKKVFEGMKKSLEGWKKARVKMVNEKFESKKMQQLQKLLKEHNEDASEENKEGSLTDFLKSLPKANEALAKFSSIANFFAWVDIKKFADQILELDNQSITHFRYILHEEYLRISNIGDHASSQIVPIGELITILKRKKKGLKADPLQKYTMGQLIATLIEVKAHIEKTRPKQ
ncbi:MAG TPA: P-loop NTPase fold protein [Candidatus Peribacteraceae bacterium]|nr:P-loop NTPase fold protein [Candidatus Peribacteraceae bacterium]